MSDPQLPAWSAVIPLALVFVVAAFESKARTAYRRRVSVTMLKWRTRPSTELGLLTIGAAVALGVWDFQRNNDRGLLICGLCFAVNLVASLGVLSAPGTVPPHLPARRNAVAIRPSSLLVAVPMILTFALLVASEVHAALLLWTVAVILLAGVERMYDPTR